MRPVVRAGLPDLPPVQAGDALRDEAPHQGKRRLDARNSGLQRWLAARRQARGVASQQHVCRAVVVRRVREVGNRQSRGTATGPLDIPASEPDAGPTARSHSACKPAQMRPGTGPDLRCRVLTDGPGWQSSPAHCASLDVGMGMSLRQASAKAVMRRRLPSASAVALSSRSTSMTPSLFVMARTPWMRRHIIAAPRRDLT